jgi:hypothetical protein
MGAYAGNQDLDPTTIDLPDDGDDADAASVTPAMEGLMDKAAYLHRGKIYPLAAAAGNMSYIWTTGSVIRVGVMTGNFEIHLYPDAAGIDPPHGHRIRVISTISRPVFTLQVWRTQPALAQMAALPLYNAAGDASYFEAMWDAVADRWIAIGWSDNVIPLITE